jgi:hypothetical protein
MTKQISGVAVMALAWFAGETGAVGDSLDRFPENAIVFELLDAGMIEQSFPSYELTPEGDALLADLKKPRGFQFFSYDRMLPMLRTAWRVKLSEFDVRGIRREMFDAKVESTLIELRAKWPRHDVKAHVHSAGGVRGVWFDRSGLPIDCTRDEYIAHCANAVAKCPGMFRMPADS